MISSSDMPVPKRSVRRAEPADRPRRDLEHQAAPAAVGAAAAPRAPGRPRGRARGPPRPSSRAIAAWVAAGRRDGRHVDRLLEERPVERIGLVEERQGARGRPSSSSPSSATSHAGHEVLDEDAVGPLAQLRHVGPRAGSPRCARRRRRTAAGSSARITPRLAESDQRLEHARVAHAAARRRRGFVVDGHGGERRPGTPAAREPPRASRACCAWRWAAATRVAAQAERLARSPRRPRWSRRRPAPPRRAAARAA